MYYMIYTKFFQIWQNFKFFYEFDDFQSSTKKPVGVSSCLEQTKIAQQ